MSRWFRVDDGLVDDPKVQRLSDRLFRAVVNLWCITSQNSGNFPHVDEIAFKLRMSSTKAARVIDEIRAAGLVDDDDDGSRPHNWNGRQFKSDVTDPTAAERQVKYRNKKRNATVTVPVTVTDTRAETEQIQSRIDIAADAAEDDGKYAFENGIIRLTAKDLAKWQKAFSYLDLAAELTGLTRWAGEQGPENWFFAVSGALAKRNRDEKIRREKPAANGHLTSSGNPWPEGIT